MLATIRGMLFTVSTVLDTRANVERWVRANRAMGVDHLLVFLDAPRSPGQPEVHDLLAGEPHVSVVRTDAAWWGGDRPRGLNVRQRINANLAAHALAGVPGAEWLFHLDGDEVFAGDPEVLAALPAGTEAAWLSPLEAVSTFSPAEHPTRFKRLLDGEDLDLLHVLGVVDQPTNQSYFHGHVLGRSGIRPGSGLRLTLHEAVDADGQVAPRAEDPALRVLHYDSISGEEFVRKWRAMLAAGPVKYRPDRAPTARALHALIGKDLPPETTDRYLRRIYDRTTADDVATLGDLGLLEHVDPEKADHGASRVTDDVRAQLERSLEALADAPKRDFHADRARRPAAAPRRSPGVRSAVARLRGH